MKLPIYPFLILFVTICTSPDLATAQVTPLEKATDAIAIKAIDYLNKNLPDSVYAMTGKNIHNSTSPKLWESIYKNQILPLLPIHKITFISSKDSLSKYKLQGTTDLSFHISLDDAGKIQELISAIIGERLLTLH